MDEQADILREQANGHRIYGASKGHRFGECTGSLRAEFGLPDTARYEAAEGTVAHDLADVWLKAGKAPRHRLGEIVTMKLHTGTYHIPIDEVMFTHVEQYVTRCLDTPGDHHFEQYVDYSILTPIPDQGGTADFFGCTFEELDLKDFKYGVADQIFAYKNPQVSLYAVGVILKYDWLYSFKRVKITICQPRLNHFDTWETTVEELMDEFAPAMSLQMFEAWSPTARRTPSERACRYCKAKLACPEAARLADALISDVFVDEREPLPPMLWTGRAPEGVALNPQWETQRTEVIVNILRHRKIVEKLFAEAQDELASRMFRGEKVPEWMIAEGKNSRVVTDSDGVLNLLTGLGLSPARAFEVKFLSPAKLETLLIKEGLGKGPAGKMLAPFIRTIPGNPVATPTKPGKREAKNIADEVFTDESEEDSL